MPDYEPVLACVTALISAFRDAGHLVETVEQRLDETMPSSLMKPLKTSLDLAPRAIEDAFQHGVRRFGDVYRRGDHVAIEQLRDIHTYLMNSLLLQLTAAWRDDTTPSLGMLEDAADLSRVKTVTILSELFMRNLETSHTFRDKPPSREQIPIEPDRQFPREPGRVLELRDEETSARAGSRRQEEHLADPAKGEKEDACRRSKWRNWKRRISDLSAAKSETSQRHNSKPLPQRRSNDSPDNPSSVDLHTVSGNYGLPALPEHEDLSIDEWAVLDNPWIGISEEDLQECIESGTVGAPSSVQQTPSPEQPSSEESTNASWSASRSSEYSVQNSMDVSANGAASLRSNVTSTAAAMLLRLPTAQNNYLGFCKGAVKLQAQMDTEAMKVSFDLRYMQSKVEFLQCSHCAFAGRVSRARVWEEKLRGVRFRWNFLAKSHVAQSKATKESYTYQCQFCAFQSPHSAFIQGTDAFMEHVASHRGEELSHAILDRIRCVNDGLAEDDSDEWDINLLPLYHQPPPPTSISPTASFKPSPSEAYSPSYFPKYEKFPFRRRSSAFKSPGPSPG